VAAPCRGSPTQELIAGSMGMSNNNAGWCGRRRRGRGCSLEQSRQEWLAGLPAIALCPTHLLVSLEQK